MENWCYHRETLLGLAAPRRDRRAAAGRAVREAARRAHVPRGLGHAAPALLRARSTWSCTTRWTPTAASRSFDVQRRVAARTTRPPAAARGSLPVRLQPHLRGRLRRRLLQLQVGRGPVGRRLRRLRGGGPRRRRGRRRDRAAASATPCSRSAAAATRWRSSTPSAAASRAPRRCCARQGCRIGHRRLTTPPRRRSGRWRRSRGDASGCRASPPTTSRAGSTGAHRAPR